VDRTTSTQSSGWGAAPEPRVVMVHPLGGLHGPARALLGLAGYLGERRDIVVAVPDGFVSTSIRSNVPGATVLHLRLPPHAKRTPRSSSTSTRRSSTRGRARCCGCGWRRACG
jgi:hypothetical protein